MSVSEMFCTGFVFGGHTRDSVFYTTCNCLLLRVIIWKAICSLPCCITSERTQWSVLRWVQLLLYIIETTLYPVCLYADDAVYIACLKIENQTHKTNFTALGQQYGGYIWMKIKMFSPGCDKIFVKNRQFDIAIFWTIVCMAKYQTQYMFVTF